MMTRLGCSTVTVLTAAVLSATPAAAAGPEEQFLIAIAYASTSWPWSTPQGAVDAGYQVCRGWTEQAQLRDRVAELSAATGLPSQRSSRFVSAATSTFCPEYSYKLL